MNLRHTLRILSFISLVSLSFSSSSDLSPIFYASSCPNVEILVKETVQSAAALDRTLPGKLLRLLFHDCMIEVVSTNQNREKYDDDDGFGGLVVHAKGCDGSVLLQGNETERSSPISETLGGFQVVEEAKRVLEAFCPGAVSCSDILVLAARDSVELVRPKNIKR